MPGPRQMIVPGAAALICACRLSGVAFSVHVNGLYVLGRQAIAATNPASMARRNRALARPRASVVGVWRRWARSNIIARGIVTWPRFRSSTFALPNQRPRFVTELT